MTSKAHPYPREGLPHLLVECLKHAFADRARWLGDPDFGDVPVDRLLSHEYIRQLSGRVGGPRDPKEYGTEAWPTTLPDDRGTSHFSIVDRQGNVVALTETINGVFGSLVVAEPFGIVLNNQMDDFTTAPGQPNLFGLVQGAANAVAPGKRPLSSMTPTIVLKTGYWDRSDPRTGVWREDPRPVLTLGASGGPRIITAVLQVMLNVTEGEMPLEQAIEQPRLHHQWLPDEVYFDRAPPAELVELLRSRGHAISEQRRGAVVQAIQILEDGTLVGASDPRKGGRPAGVP
jgi:gamma-glutamyltranspeptidase/glutathione hydrolase